METAQTNDAHQSVQGQRTTLMRGMLVAVLVTLIVWCGLFWGLPPLQGMEEPVARLVFALECCCVAVLFCFVSGIEAVSHERLHSAAIDPLSGYETHRMRVNLRYLQQTLEQLLVFIPGLLALAALCDSGEAMRAVVAVTGVWVLSRFAFWIGYHKGSQYRAIGLTGMVQSMIVLLYVCARFGYDYAGVAGALAPLVAFAAIEIVLVRVTASPTS